MQGDFLFVILLLVAVLMANWPFMNQRKFFVFKNESGVKSFALRLSEWFFLYLVFGLLTLGMEGYLGQVYQQGWEFYVITLAVFATLAFPGFVFRYLLKNKIV